MTFGIGKEALVIGFVKLVNLLLSLLIEFFTSFQRDPIVKRDSQTGLRAVVEALVLKQVPDMGGAKRIFVIVMEDLGNPLLDPSLVNRRTERLEMAVLL